MSTANARNGSTIEPGAAQATTPHNSAHRLSSGLHQDHGPVLAQIPDLDLPATAKVPEKAVEGRVISQSLSAKLVFGVGLALVIGAILPFVFGKASRREQPVKELPEWSGSGASLQITGSSSQTTGPTLTSSPTAPLAATASPQSQPTPPPAILLPQPPQVGDTRPTALTEPSWTPPRSTITPATAVTPSPNNYPNAPDANAGWPANPGFARPVDPRALQADNRNDPAAPYRNNDPRNELRGNNFDAAPIRRDVPTSGYPRDARYDNGSGFFPPAADRGSPLMPSATQGPAPGYPNSLTPEPGVARFDGTIATPPPVRTSYDRSGSSTN